LYKDKIAAGTNSTKAGHLNADDEEESTKMIPAMNYRQVFAGVTAGVMSGHNMRTAKLSDLDTVDMFKLTASKIGEVKCVKLPPEGRVVDPGSYEAQRLLHSLSVSGPRDLDVDKLKELLAIALRKTEAVHQSKLAGAVDVSAEGGAAEVPTRSTNQDEADRPMEVEVEVPEFPDRNENEPIKNEPIENEAVQKGPIGGDLIPPAGGQAPARRFGAGESLWEPKQGCTCGWEASWGPPQGQEQHGTVREVQEASLQAGDQGASPLNDLSTSE
jgi:hypothetical protein